MNPAEQLAILPAQKTPLQNLSFGDMAKAAQMISKSGFIPKEFIGQPESILAAWMFGTELGLLPMQALNSVCVINGKPSLYGDSLLAVVQAQPGFEDNWDEDNFDTAPRDEWEIKFYVKFKDRKPSVGKYTWEDAQLAGLTGKDNWKKYPKDMMVARARARACKNACPAALKGLEISDIAQDIVPADVIVRDAPVATRVEVGFEQPPPEMPEKDDAFGLGKPERAKPRKRKAKADLRTPLQNDIEGIDPDDSSAETSVQPGKSGVLKQVGIQARRLKLNNNQLRDCATDVMGRTVIEVESLGIHELERLLVELENQ